MFRQFPGPYPVWVLVALMLYASPTRLSAQLRTGAPPPQQVVDIGRGITLHYVEKGSGPAVIFVHGSLSDYSYWDDQIEAFGKHFRAIAYSRRYNYPNQNPSRPGYSAVADARDLASLIQRLRLGKAYIVGHSYGALTGLFLAVTYPERIRALVLAEAPAVSLLRELPASQAEEGYRIYADIQRRMVRPMQRAFAKGDTSAGVGIFIDFVFNDVHAWTNMTAPDRERTLRDAHEWEVMMTTGTLFPRIDPAAIRAIRLPVLLLSGTTSYGFLKPIDAELARLIAGSRRIVYPKAGHQMWLQNPDQCRQDVEAFFRDVERASTVAGAGLRGVGHGSARIPGPRVHD